MKAKSITLATSDQDLVSAQRTPEEIAFDLYLKNREVQQINQSLQKILLMKQQQRSVWINENEEMINQLLDSFMEDSNLILDGVKLQGEALSLSVEFITNLRDSLAILKNLLHPQTKANN